MQALVCRADSALALAHRCRRLSPVYAVLENAAAAVEQIESKTVQTLRNKSQRLQALVGEDVSASFNRQKPQMCPKKRAGSFCFELH